jgi:D-glycero-D-manno-heptose 1,7-bisphosphate phosphatase
VRHKVTIGGGSAPLGQTRPGCARYPAVFLDRDGTLVRYREYPRVANDLWLYEEICPDLLRIRRAGFRLVVVTNQSGVARGLYSETDVRSMHEHLVRQLTQFGVDIDGIYYCPHHPDGVVPQFAIRCACRKPESGLLLEAAA